MDGFFQGYWDTLLIALVALIVWTMGNVRQHKGLILAGKILTGVAFALYVLKKLL